MPRHSASAGRPTRRPIFVEAEAIDTCRCRALIDAPELDPARRIAAALESARVDPPFQKALPDRTLASGRRGITRRLSRRMRSKLRSQGAASLVTRYFGSLWR